MPTHFPFTDRVDLDIDIIVSEFQLLAIVDHQVVGSLNWSHPGDESGSLNLVIDRLAVAPAYRRRGIGAALVKTLLETCAARWVSLWTSKEMEIARSHRFYAKLGFQELAKQDDYYGDGIDTRLFTIRLQ